MKKNQSGVSLITLVITIIVVIILAMVAFAGGTRPITNANFGDYTNNVSEVQQAVSETAITLRGNEAQKGTTRNDAQAYNYVAKGAPAKGKDDDNKSWLTRKMSQDLSATYINPDTYKEVFGKDLPDMKVNTTNGSNRQVSYFVTKTGKVFTWPPYEYGDETEAGLYVMGGQNEGYIGKDKSGDATNGFYIVGSGEKLSPETDLNSIKGIVVDGVDIKIDSANAAPLDTADINDKSGDLANIATVYYKDASNATRPVGLEATTLFNDGSVPATPATPATPSDSE